MDRAPERALDEYLVSLSQAGSIEALDGLARHWTPRLLRYTTRVFGGSGDAVETARDVVQETWVGVIRGLRGLRDPSRFPGWIYGIATRKCADAIRAHSRRRRLDSSAAPVDAGKEASVEPEEQIDLATAIQGLPPMHRAAIHLFYREDLSVEEIADVLGIPTGTVKSRLYHARDVLRRQLGAIATDRNQAASRKRGIS